MESNCVGKLMFASEKEIAGVRAAVGLSDQDSIKRDVDMVLEWYDKQYHLPRVQPDRDFVERVLVSRKGSVEQTKQKIDMLYTLRTAIPDMASPRDILHPDIQKQFESVIVAVMPKLNPDLTRVLVYKMTTNEETFVLADTLKYLFMILEYRLKHDYCSGDHFIFDLGNVTLTHVSKLNPIVLKKAESFLSAYGNRMFGLHYVNSPKFVEIIVNLVKGALSAKLMSRLMVHSSLEDLHKVINKSILPIEYGGDEDPLEKIAGRWKRELLKEENRQYLVEQESMRSNEALRVGERDSDDILGIPGSFKTINID